MKSAVFESKGQLRIIERPVPQVGPTDVLLRTRYCGICGTDVHAYAQGLHIPYGTVMGHELCGEVVAHGQKVRGYEKGSRVAVNPMPWCGTCFHCRRGEYTLCEIAIREEIGFSPEYDGGLAEYVLIRSPREMLIALPDSVSFEAAALVEPLAVSLHAVRMSRHALGSTALVLGAGMIGLGIIAFLRFSGAGRIVAADLSTAKLELARGMGADVLIQPRSNEELVERVRELLDGRGPEVVFECAGTAGTFRLAPQCARKGGQVIIVGFCEQDVPINPLDLVLRAVELKAVLGYHDDFNDVVRFLERKPFEAADLITDIVPLDDADAKGFQRVLNDPETVRVLVQP